MMERRERTIRKSVGRHYYKRQIHADGGSEWCVVLNCPSLSLFPLTLLFACALHPCTVHRVHCTVEASVLAVAVATASENEGESPDPDSQSQGSYV